MPNLDFFSTPYNRMLNDHFSRLLDEVEERRVTYKRKEDWLAQRKIIRKKLLEYLNPLLEIAKKTPLNAKVTGIVEREGYRIEKVLSQSLPNFYITASVYIPSNISLPVPAILCPHGHWPKGRYDAKVQIRCIGLALRGYIALSLDMVGYNERMPMSHFNTHYLLMSGVSVEALHDLDNMRAIDYLCSRPDVDSQKIGCTGASGGGNHTMYVAALDERIRVAVPVCSVERFVDYLNKGACICETVPGIATYADIPEICSLIAPRPLLVINGTLDTGFPIAVSRQAITRISDIYKLMRVSKRFSTFEVYSGHDYNREMREAMYAWFDRWLMGIENKKNLVESDILVESEDSDVLRVCDKKGLPEPYETVSSLYHRLSTNLPLCKHSKNEEPRQWQKKLRQDIKEILGWSKEPELLEVKKGNFEKREGYNIEVLAYRSEKDIWIPALLLQPNQMEKPLPAIVYLSPQDKRIATERREVSLLLKQGFAVLSLDYRGIGETTDRDKWAWMRSVILGRPIFRVRVWDIICGLFYLHSLKRIDNEQLYLWGEGEAGLLSLFAGALNKDIRGVVAQRCLVSYKGEEKESFRLSHELVIPKILRYADVCDIISLIAPRYVLFTNGISIEGKRINKIRAEESLKRAKKIYSDMKCSECFEIFTGNDDEATKRILDRLSSFLKRS